MRFRRNCILIAVTGLAVWAGGLVWLARAAVIEGAYEACVWEWRAYAQNGGYWLPGPNNLYIIAHGWYGKIYPNCGRPDMTPNDISPKYDFIFVGACDGMVKTGPGTFSSRAKEAVGYANMSERYCDGCWNHSLAFQDYLFRRHAAGYPWSIAYDQTITAFPECRACARYYNRAADIVQSIIQPWLLQ